jgi:hypothetical protein
MHRQPFIRGRFTSRSIAVVVVLALGAVLLLTVAAADAASETVRQVFVTNFPKVQTIDGEVAINKPVPLAQLRSFTDITVPPVAPTDTTRLVDAGVLVADGFPGVVLSLHGEVKGNVQKPGSVGVFLIPDQETIQRAFRELGLVHFALETVAPDITSRTAYFASTQPRYTVAFPAYRVLLYNTTDKAVSANLYAYLTN